MVKSESSKYHTPPVKMIDDRWAELPVQGRDFRYKAGLPVYGRDFRYRRDFRYMGGTSGIGAGLPVYGRDFRYKAGLPV